MTGLEKINDKYRMFASFGDSEGSFQFSLQDNIIAQGFETLAGSRMMEGYRPPFDATLVKKLREAGGALVGKTNMDEFGCGSFGTNSAFGIPLNPYDIKRSCGGAAGGSACAAAVLKDHVSVAVSTGGSVVCPASFCGVYGLAATYGRVSRNGVIDVASSMDSVGVMSAKSAGLGKALGIMQGKDPLDPVSYAQHGPIGEPTRMKSVAVPRELTEGLSPDVERIFKDSLETLRSQGISVDIVDMPLLKYAFPAYYVLAASEASTSLAKLCGMRYGHQDGDIDMKFDDYFTEMRTKYLGDEAKRRIVLGTFLRFAGNVDRYHNKALRVRMSVVNAYKEVLKDHDAVVSPTMPFVAPRIEDTERMSLMDSYKASRLTLGASLTGMPHLTVPCGYSEGMPVGLMFTADHWNEHLLLGMASQWEESFEFKAPEVDY